MAVSPMSIDVRLVPLKVRNLLLISSMSICLLSLFTDLLRIWAKASGPGVSNGLLGKAFLYNIAPFFNVGVEANLPTFYSSVLLLGAASCFLLASHASKLCAHKKIITNSWRMLAVFFALLSLDEFVAFHEKLKLIMTAMGKYIFIPNFMKSVWYSSAIVICLALLAFLIPLLRSLSPKVKGLFIFSGLAFIGGAIGVEAVSLRVMNNSQDFSFDFLYLLLSTLEEFLEMAGVSLAIYAILVYISEWVDVARVSFRD